MLTKLLFPDHAEPRHVSVGLLLLRVGSGLLMALTHGWSKMATYGAHVGSWADPIGIGSAASLTLAVFAELLCSLALVLGLLTRAAAIPLIVTMLVAALVVHADDPFQKKELGLLYLVPFLTLLVTGPGRFSLDAAIGRRLRR